MKNRKLCNQSRTAKLNINFINKKNLHTLLCPALAKLLFIQQSCLSTRFATQTLHDQRTQYIVNGEYNNRAIFNNNK